MKNGTFPRSLFTLHVEPYKHVNTCTFCYRLNLIFSHICYTSHSKNGRKTDEVNENVCMCLHGYRSSSKFLFISIDVAKQICILVHVIRTFMDNPLFVATKISCHKLVGSTLFGFSLHIIGKSFEMANVNRL